MATIRKVRVLEIEIIEGVYGDWIGNTVQVYFSNTDLKVGDQVQVGRVGCSTSINITKYNDSKTVLGVNLPSQADMPSMLGKVSRVVFGFDGMSNDNTIRDNKVIADDYDSEITEPFTRVFDLNGNKL